MTSLLISSSVLILALIALRRLLRGRVSLRLQYALWLLVAIRLLVLLPFPLLPSSFSVLNVLPENRAPDVQAPMREEVTVLMPGPEAGTPVQPASPGAGMSGADELGADVLEAPGQGSYEPLLAALWAVGAAVMAVWFFGVNISFRRRLKQGAERVEHLDCPIPVYCAPTAPSPCLVGLLRQQIYVTPECLKHPERMRHVLAHELTHRRHGDPWWSLVRAVCLCLYWFDPLVWWAAALSRRDCELACDEGAIRLLGEAERIAYGRTLVALIAGGVSPAGLLQTATTMQSGKRGVRERIALIAQKPRHLAAATACLLLAAAVTVGCTFTGAKTPEPEEAPPLTAPQKPEETAPSPSQPDRLSEVNPAQPEPPQPEQLPEDAPPVPAVTPVAQTERINYAGTVFNGGQYEEIEPVRTYGGVRRARLGPQIEPQEMQLVLFEREGDYVSVTVTNRADAPLALDLGAGSPPDTVARSVVPAGQTVTRTLKIRDWAALNEQSLYVRAENADPERRDRKMDYDLEVRMFAYPDAIQPGMAHPEEPEDPAPAPPVFPPYAEHPEVYDNAMRGDRALILARGGILLPDNDPSNYVYRDGVYYKLFCSKPNAQGKSMYFPEVAVGNVDWIVGRWSDQADVLRQMEADLPGGEYPKNSRGESYGKDLFSEYVGYEPDLTVAQAENGAAGYIRTSELRAVDFENLSEEALERMEIQGGNLVVYINVYDSEGITAIGSFSVSRPVSDIFRDHPGITVEEAKKLLAEGAA